MASVTDVYLVEVTWGCLVAVTSYVKEMMVVWPENAAAKATVLVRYVDASCQTESWSADFEPGFFS